MFFFLNFISCKYKLILQIKEICLSWGGGGRVESNTNIARKLRGSNSKFEISFKFQNKEEPCM